MKHGADLLTYGGDRLIDYSSNINPLGPPKGLKDYLSESFDSLLKYPDIKYRRLKANLANYLKTDAKNLVVGNGSMEIIDLLLASFDYILIPYPSFSEYRQRAEIRGKKIVDIPPTSELSLDAKKIYSLLDSASEGSCLIIGNPTNPTGYGLDKEKLEGIYDKCVKNKVQLILDEAFFEFLDFDYDTVEIFKKTSFKNIAIIRAATKFFALPGLRLGYGIVNEDMIEKVEALQSPWTVNSLAVSASDIIFKDKSYIEKTRRENIENRCEMIKRLKEIEGLIIYPSRANFILIKLSEKADDLFNYLLDKNYLIRLAASFKGLDDSFIRLAVKDRENNNILINYMEEFYEK